MSKGLHAVIVSPPRVYGPGLLSESNGMTRIIHRYEQGKWRLIPGDGSKISNYVFVDDVVHGHWLAMEKGKSGEKYILGGQNASYNEFFSMLKHISQKNYRLYKIPIWAMLLFAHMQLLLAKIFHKNPLITPIWVKKYLHNWELTSEKAQKELGYVITPLEVGLKKTLLWIRNS